MAIEKVSTYDRLEVVREYSIQCRRKDSYVEDGNELSFSYHRHVLHPDSDWSSEPQQVKNLADALFTAEVKAAYEQKLIDDKALQDIGRPE